MSDPVITVVIPAYNEEHNIAACLQHVLDQSLDLPFEVIVSNNNSSDRTPEIASEMGARVVNSTDKGYVHAAIAGVQAAQAPIIAMTDCDTRVPRDWLKNIYEALRDQPELVAIGGPFEFYDGAPSVQRSIRVVNQISPRLMIASLSGMNMAFRKEAYEAVGGFDPEINLQADTYLGKQLQDHGKTALLRHNVVQSSGRRYQTGPQIILETFVRVVNALWLTLFRTTLFKRQLDIR